MAIAQVGTPAHGAQANGSTAFTATLPQAATAGNVLLVGVCYSAAAARTLTVPAGWTLLGNLATANSTSAGGLWIIGKVAAGGETGPSIAWTGGTMVPAWATMELSGVDTTAFPAAPTPPASDYVSSTAAGPTTLTADARTTAANGEAIVTFFGGRGPSGGITHTWDANETEVVSANSGQVGNIYAAWQTVATAGTTRTPSLTSFTNSQGNPVTLIGWVALKLAVDTVTVTNPGAQSGTVGTAITPLAVVATDSFSHTLTYSASGLPPGLSINSSTGSITGTPTTAGTYSSATVTATCTGSQSDSKTFTWTISAGGTAAKVNVAGTMTAATPKVNVAGTMTTATPKVNVAGVMT